MTSPLVTQTDYEVLAAFRYELRRFLNFSEQAAKTLGMSPQQHQALLAIRAASGQTLTVGELADQLFIQPHTASELAERMMALDWIERRPTVEDRRRVRLGLTDRSERLLAEMSETHRNEVLRIRATLTDLLARLGQTKNQ